ncbi:MAG: heme-binding protein [Verrucomicrobia bacterium]|nr:heme-binding protein [Verrucomicrobiota bacterium]
MKSLRRVFIHILALLPAFPTLAQISPPMTVEEVRAVIAQAATRALEISPKSVIAVVDREGFVLGVWSLRLDLPAFDTTPLLNFGNDVANAIAKAGTAAFLSSNEHAFTSRTAGFIVQQHFPPGVDNKPPGPLVGVNFSSLSFSDVNRYKGPPFGPALEGGTNGKSVPMPVTGGLIGSPGGVPLYRNGKLIGGIGVAGDGDNELAIQTEQVYDLDEDVALAGQMGFEPSKRILGSHVFVDGIRFAYVNSSTSLQNPKRLADLPGKEVLPYTLRASSSVAYPPAVLGVVNGEIRQPIIDDPVPGLINGQPRLSAVEVSEILAAAALRAQRTRAGIRLPRGLPAQVFISVVNNPNASEPAAPMVLGTFRTPDATIFSWDVAVQKARTALFFSSNTRAFSSRTVGFLSQSLFPPGIIGTSPGIFLGLQEKFSQLPLGAVNPLNGAAVTAPPADDPNLPNGITIFPGGFPLYRNGVLIGAIGVSGDGVDQDDLIAATGAGNYLPPDSIRADRFSYRGARLPFAKFPRNPSSF